MLDIPVLIAGGGPVGLTASLLLSKHGVRSLLVERHPGTAIVPLREMKSPHMNRMRGELWEIGSTRDVLDLQRDHHRTTH